MRWLVIASALAVAACSRCGAGRSVDAGLAAVPDADWLAGRPTPEDAGTPRRGGTLTVRLPVEPLGFSRIHDRFAEGTMVRATTGTIYEALGRIDAARPDGPLLPWLARGWTLGDALTISLAPDVRFHDGSTFTSADLKAVLGVVLEPKNATVGLRAAIGDVASVETPDDLTALVRWKRPPSPFEVRALLGAVPMMPSEALAGDFDSLAIHQAPVGTGPFAFGSFVKGDRLVLTRFDRHRTPARLDSIVFRVVKDDTVAAQLWEKGELDLMTRIPPPVWRAVESQPWAFTGYRRFRVDENAYAWIGWNRRRPVFQDVRVRRALAMLYPAEIVSRTVELGLESRTTCPFLLGSASCDPDVKPLPFDPAGAKALLDEAGWTMGQGGVRTKGGQRLTFSFLMPTTSQRLGRVLPLYQEQLALAGVELTLEPVDAAQSIARMRAHDFDAAAMSWSSPDAVSDQFELFHSSQIDGGKNYVALTDPAIDALLEQIRRATEPAERQALERTLHRALFDDQVYLFLTARPALDAVKRRVHGLAPSIAWYDLSKAWVDP
jgi:peptide/nickel transport system substrate-binding protein